MLRRQHGHSWWLLRLNKLIYPVRIITVSRNTHRRNDPRLRIQELIMTIEEYMALYPQDAVYIQVDDTERLMTDEEYEAWVVNSVYNINNLTT